MKPWHIIFLCLLAAAFYLFSYSSSSSSISLTGSRSLKMSLPHHRNRYPEAKVTLCIYILLVIGKINFQDGNSFSNNGKFKNWGWNWTQVVDEGWQSSSGKGSMGMGIKYSRSKEIMDEDEVVNYHIDYHGVTTHPTPTPKHPKP